MSGTIERYLEAKYSSGGPGSDRFDPVDSEIHASQLSDCQRKRKWKHDRGTSSDPSPYFELGRVFETLYGAVLAYEHDSDIIRSVLKSKPSWAVVELSTVVVQDVNVEIEIGDDATIVGEADWVVLDQSCPSVKEPAKYGELDKVRVSQDGDRHALFSAGDDMTYSADWVKKVVETKTKKDVDWIHRKGADEKHVYQVYPYMHALDSDGEIAYMQRNDWEEEVVSLDYDPNRWLDILMRASAHSSNQAADEDEVPPTTPLDDDECHWCKFKQECKKHGGSKWKN